MCLDQASNVQLNGKKSLVWNICYSHSVTMKQGLKKKKPLFSAESVDLIKIDITFQFNPSVGRTRGN